MHSAKGDTMKYLVNIFKGLAIGVATLVPGVSGGTMAIVLGIYDDLLHAVGSFFKDWKKHTIFLAQLGIGGLLGVLLLSRLLEDVIGRYPFVMGFFFIGVILGGVPVLYKKSMEGKSDIRNLIFLIIGFAIVLLLSAEPEATTTLATMEGFKSVIFLFVAGLVIAVALVLPGISASFMLYVMGLYSVTLNAINTRNIPFLVPLAIGVGLGTLATTKAIEMLLQKYAAQSYMLILGFVLGSLKPVFPGIPKGYSAVASVAALVIGFLIIRWLSKKELA